MTCTDEVFGKRSPGNPKRSTAGPAELTLPAKFYILKLNSLSKSLTAALGETSQTIIIEVNVGDGSPCMCYSRVGGHLGQ